MRIDVAKRKIDYTNAATGQDLEVLGDLSVTGDIVVAGAHDVTGDQVFTGTLNVTGAVDFDSTLNVDGVITNDGLTTAGPVGITGDSTLTGELSLISAANGLIIQDAGTAANTQKITIRQVSTTVTSGADDATLVATNLIPAGCFLIGITGRVTTTLTGASAFTIGDGSDPDRWGTGIALTADTTFDQTDATAEASGTFASATSVTFTATTANFSAGAIRVTAHYIALTAEAS